MPPTRRRRRFARRSPTPGPSVPDDAFCPRGTPGYDPDIFFPSGIRRREVRCTSPTAALVPAGWIFFPAEHAWKACGFQDLASYNEHVAQQGLKYLTDKNARELRAQVLAARRLNREDAVSFPSLNSSVLFITCLRSPLVDLVVTNLNWRSLPFLQKKYVICRHATTMLISSSYCSTSNLPNRPALQISVLL
jgi:hypothetical protein